MSYLASGQLQGQNLRVGRNSPQAQNLGFSLFAPPGFPEKLPDLEVGKLTPLEATLNQWINAPTSTLYWDNLGGHSTRLFRGSHMRLSSFAIAVVSLFDSSVHAPALSLLILGISSQTAHALHSGKPKPTQFCKPPTKKLSNQH